MHRMPRRTGQGAADFLKVAGPRGRTAAGPGRSAAVCQFVLERSARLVVEGFADRLGYTRRCGSSGIPGLKPADVGKIIGTSRATLYRYLSMDA